LYARTLTTTPLFYGPEPAYAYDAKKAKQLLDEAGLASRGCYGPLETTLQQFNQWLVRAYQAAWAEAA